MRVQMIVVVPVFVAMNNSIGMYVRVAVRPAAPLSVHSPGGIGESESDQEPGRRVAAGRLDPTEAFHCQAESDAQPELRSGR